MTTADTYAALTPKGRKLMAEIGDWHGSFFDDGIVEGSGIWGSQLNDELGMSNRSFSGIMNGLRKAGLWGWSEGDAQDDSGWWYLTALGAEVALYAASLPIHGKPQGEAVQEAVRTQISREMKGMRITKLDDAGQQVGEPIVITGKSAAAGQAKAASKKVAATKATATKKAKEVAAADNFVADAVNKAIAAGSPVVVGTSRYAAAKLRAAEGTKRGPGRKVTDEEVVAFITNIRAMEPGITRNQAEQVSYWVEKFACGVDRFNKLWDEVVAG